MIVELKHNEVSTVTGAISFEKTFNFIGGTVGAAFALQYIITNILFRDFNAAIHPPVAPGVNADGVVAAPDAPAMDLNIDQVKQVIRASKFIVITTTVISGCSLLGGAIGRVIDNLKG